MPAGAYWIPMDQPQKHWIQATLGEDPYVPFPYFYDVSSWSNPLLMGMPTLYTGDRRAAVGRAGPRARGRRRAPARRTRSYGYSLDSSQAAALTFRLLDRGVALRRDTERNVVSLSARRAPHGLGPARARARRRRRRVAPAAAGERVPLRSLGLFAGTGISTTLRLLRRVPLRDRAALGALGDDGHDRRRQRRHRGVPGPAAR